MPAVMNASTAYGNKKKYIYNFGGQSSWKVIT